MTKIERATELLENMTDDEIAELLEQFESEEEEEQANDFLKNTNTIFKSKLLGKRWCNWDDKLHNKYCVALSRNGETYNFTFTDSLYNTRKGTVDITAYDVLSCLTKYEVADNVWDFADEFGYSISNKIEYEKAKTTWEAVQKEYSNVKRLFSDCMEELQEIC